MFVLSLIIIGSGQMVLGQTLKGIAMLAGTIAIVAFTCGYGLILAPFICLLSAFDAHAIANKLRRGTPVGAWEFF
jgi:hypothetical protein